MVEEAFDAEVRVRGIRFASDDGMFAVIAVETVDGDELTAAGPLAHLEPGARARIVGRFTEHARYGLQIEADGAYELDPDDIDGALKYLTTIKRIGKRRARQLVDRYGASVLDTIDADPEGAFRTLPRMNERAVAAAVQSWRDRRALRDLYVLLAPHGAGWLAGPLHERYGSDAVLMVRDDPYRLAEEHGVGFHTADAIARAHGVPSNAPSRYRAAVVHALGEAESRGHTFLPAAELSSAVEQLLGELPQGETTDAAAADSVVVEGDRVALRATWLAEAKLAEHFVRLATTAPVKGPPHWLGGEVEGLTEEQRQAVLAAFERRLSVVTGGPGTGKTTLVRTIAALAARAQLSVALCAPTGRAARRLEEATGVAATTIHRLLEWLPHQGPARGPDYPLQCDLLVVDEGSMLSLQVAKMLFDAVDSGTVVVMVGDADQLPPVGAGKPFADLIASERAPVTRLTHVFRQSAQSMIVSAAHAVRNGQAPSAQPDDGQVRDFFVMEHRFDTDAADTVVELATTRLARYYELDPIRDIQVLSPMYNGALGIDALNARLRAELNPDGEELLDSGIRAADKLIQTRNDYDVGLMNGQIVIALDADEDEDHVVVESDDGRRVEVPSNSLRSLRPAYAISVHRSQGCEMPVVVIPIHVAQSRMLSRNLLYTAITRAKQACVLVGQPEAIRRAVGRTDAFRRHTRLAELVA